MAVWYFGKPQIPFSGLVLSFGALSVPVIGTFWFPETTGYYELLLWLLALVPAFLLAYYRGWTGVALAMLIGMVVLSTVQVLVILLDIRTDWTLLLGVVAAYVSIGLCIGLVSELLHQERARAEKLALLDDVTGMPNRRLGELFLEKEFAAAERGRVLSVVFFDIDQFKHYNDRYGHATGDDALRHFARLLEKRTRKMDLCARYGGDEFIAILSGGDLAAGIGFGQSVRALLAEEPLEPGVEPFTVSVGVAEFRRGMASALELVEVADQAMYRAKDDGRDQVHASRDG